MSDTDTDAPIPTDPAAISEEISELEGRMADTHAWGHDKAGQERVRQLYEAQESAGVEAPEEVSKSERQLEIEEMMKEADGEY